MRIAVVLAYEGAAVIQIGVVCIVRSLPSIKAQCRGRICEVVSHRATPSFPGDPATECEIKMRDGIWRSTFASLIPITPPGRKTARDLEMPA